MATKDKTLTWYGTIYRWSMPNIKVNLPTDYTVPRSMLNDIGFKINLDAGVVVYDPDELIDKYFPKGALAILDPVTLMKFDAPQASSVLYTTEVLVKLPGFGGVLLKSGPLQMRLSISEKIQCANFQRFMAAALR